jgi:glycine/D-amino acid oxidase-like deaminating enzyme/nitrite reductase/ring-hydroxylating ferredoxin subunit
MRTAEPAPALPGRLISPWLDEPERPTRAPLERDLEVEVAVLGAGIIGLTTAFELQRRGISVAVLEGRQVAGGVTGNTTAKLSSLHGLSYDSIRSTRGEQAAASYAQANQWGIERVAELARELAIDCDLRRKPNFTYTEDPERLGELESEVDAALAVGLPASFTVDTDLPFDVAGAVRFDDQAEFQPVAYLLGLAAALDGEAQTVYERSRAVDVSGTTVTTETGRRVSARRVVVATQLPFLDRGLFFARASVERSYGLSVRIRAPIPQGMYLQAERPGRSLRSLRWRGEELLLVGGESHEAGHGEAADKFEALARYAHERFDVTGFEHRWSAHDFMPEDGLPYIGRLWPLSDRVLTATGMRKWGLAMGTAAARMLADEITGQPNEWAAVFDPRRLPPLSSAPKLLKHNAEAGVFFFGDRARRGHGTVDLAPGEGRVIAEGLGQRAVHRDHAGVLHAVSARCTHLGCIVRWNAAERTWDCPCHGSRFEATGAVLTGPATQQLEPRAATEDG